MSKKLEKLHNQLLEAEDALHSLLIGKKEIVVSVGDTGSVTFHQTSIKALETHISKIKNKIASLTMNRNNIRQPIYFNIN